MPTISRSGELLTSSWCSKATLMVIVLWEDLNVLLVALGRNKLVLYEVECVWQNSRYCGFCWLFHVSFLRNNTFLMRSSRWELCVWCIGVAKTQLPQCHLRTSYKYGSPVVKVRATICISWSGAAFECPMPKIQRIFLLMRKVISVFAFKNDSQNAVQTKQKLWWWQTSRMHICILCTASVREQQARRTLTFRANDQETTKLNCTSDS